MSERITASLANSTNLIIDHRIKKSLKQLRLGKSRINTWIRLGYSSHPSYRTVFQEREVVLLSQCIEGSELGVTVWHFPDGHIVSALVLRGVGGAPCRGILLGKFRHFQVVNSAVPL